MSLVTAISLRTALKSIVEYAFQSTPYPVILTIENHVIKQQNIMADIFTEILGKQLYVPPATASSTLRSPLPSPNQLKHKFILRGKAIGCSLDEHQEVEDINTLSILRDRYSSLDRLISLRQVKLGTNIYADINDRKLSSPQAFRQYIIQLDPSDASPSLSERKVVFKCPSMCLVKFPIF